jgi:hypothetical protein
VKAIDELPEGSLVTGAESGDHLGVRHAVRL